MDEGGTPATAGDSIAHVDDRARFLLLLAASEALRAAGGSDSERAALVREVFGNPFRPEALERCWLTADVAALARAAYEERRLPEGTLEPARLGLLADALEEAGCDNADILGHLRGEGAHVRGCWAVDLVLGKE